MNTKRKNSGTIAVLLAVMSVMLLFPLTGSAAGTIDTERDSYLHIFYQNGDMPLEGAEFCVYKLAGVDEYASLTVTEEFSGYPVELEGIDQEGWRALAVTLKGFALRDELQPCAARMTNDAGRADITLKPGLYLVFASPVTTEDMDTYFSDPFIVQLPAMDDENNAWIYEESTRPKNTDYTTMRRVLKIWDDEGYETLRPEEVTVDLLCDGEISDTVVLTAENSWRYDWGELDPGHEWLAVERVPEGYHVTTERSGKVFTVTNSFVAPVSADGITVQKKITGDKPASTALFTFTLTAKEKGNPMPEGTEGDTAEVSVKGAGYASFGRIRFDRAGIYNYEVKENAGDVEGWTYDKTMYTVTFTVTEDEGVLHVDRRISSDGAEKDVIEFNNPYRTPDERLPQTGLLWWPVPVLLIAGMVLLLLGTVRRKEDGYDR